MTRVSVLRTVRFGLVGILLGYILSRIGFTDFGEVHNMFLLTDLRMFLTFCGSVAVAPGSRMSSTRSSPQAINCS